MDKLLRKKLDEYIDKWMPKERQSFGSSGLKEKLTLWSDFSWNGNNEDDLYVEDEQVDASINYKYSSVQRKKVSLDNFIKDEKDDNNFKNLLFKMIDERNLTDAEVYNKVNIDRRLFSKIRNDKYYHPKKETVILFAFALELNEDDMDKLLSSAEYSLPRNTIFNLIIRFCFQEHIYDLFKVNEMLEEHDCEILA